MATDRLQRAALWLYKQTDRSGLLETAPARRVFEWAYAQYKRRLEDPFHHLARRHPELFGGGHVLDVGANIGYTARVFASVLQPGFSVWAFEPASDNIRALQGMVGRSGLEASVQIVRAAVSDHAGTIDLVLNPDHPADHRIQAGADGIAHGRSVERVRLTTIDDEVSERGLRPVAFIKIDVQGCELSVCRGMVHTLDENPAAAIAVEFAPDLMRTFGDKPTDLPRFFAARGYRPFRLALRGEMAPMSDADFLAPMPSRGYIDVLFLRPNAEAGR
jgi:FkbM family methyltransferase